MGLAEFPRAGEGGERAVTGPLRLGRDAAAGQLFADQMVLAFLFNS